MSLLERCPHCFHGGCYVQASMKLYVSVSLSLSLSLPTAAKRHSVVSGGHPMTELPEADQDEEMPLLPPDKDPSTHQTNPLIGKTPVKNKRLVCGMHTSMQRNFITVNQ